MTEIDANDLQLVIEYFRNKAATLEFENIELQLQVRKLNARIEAVEATANALSEDVGLSNESAD